MLFKSKKDSIVTTRLSGILPMFALAACSTLPYTKFDNAGLKSRRALNLPLLYAITDAGKYGVAALMPRLEAALACCLRLIRVRDDARKARAVHTARGRCGLALSGADAGKRLRNIGTQGRCLRCAFLRHTNRAPHDATTHMLVGSVLPQCRGAGVRAHGIAMNNRIC